MSARDVVDRISGIKDFERNLKYCLVDSLKFPYKIDNTFARSNQNEDFVSLDEIKKCKNLSYYTSLGVSIQASNIFAIDVDDCFSIPFDINSADSRGKYLISMFAQTTYTEFSFSGKGLRILFYTSDIENYDLLFYTKNSSVKIEFYRPNGSPRYVTLTGRNIGNAFIERISINIITEYFLNVYMRRTGEKKGKTSSRNSITLFECLVKIKRLYYRDHFFQDLWFSEAPGSGRDESERDFKIVKYILEEITNNREVIREAFECSPYFNSKDNKHIMKWENNNHKYFNQIYEKLVNNG